MLALWRNSSVPRGALVLYTASVIPIAFGAIFPESALQLGLVGLAMAIIGLAVWMLRNVPESSLPAGPRDADDLQGLRVQQLPDAGVRVQDPNQLQ
ncbi:hypothetical protein GCM10009712_40860 [Pseudarthrobacter sulfonivorans]